MKKNLSITFIICASFYFCTVTSCQKEFTPDGIELGGTGKVSSKDPIALSKAIKVWHGVRTQGAPPVPNAASPALDPQANPSIPAIQGRYAIIKPEVTSGTIAGYYLGIPGTTEYFKIDFSRQRILERNLIKKRDGILSRTGNADSSIVIVLPPNINAPDTFCVTYCPYDSLGNIGQPVTTCIYVSAFGAGANNGWLQNDFKLTATWGDSGVVGNRTFLDTTIFNRMVKDFNGFGYVCDAGVLRQLFSQGGSVVVADSVKVIKDNFRLALNGAFDYTNEDTEKDVDVNSSTCSIFNFVMNPYNEVITGGYSYNELTRKLTMIFEFDDAGIPEVEYAVYDMNKINNNHFVLSETDSGETFFIRFER